MAKQPSTRPNVSTVAREGGRHRRLVTDIAFEREHFAAGLFELRLGDCVLGRVGAPDADIGTGLRDRFGKAEPDPAVATRDNSDFAGEIEGTIGHVVLLPELKLRAGGC